MTFSRFLSALLLAALLMTCHQPLKKRSLLVIGDSNGAAVDGWVYQLQNLRGGGPLVNTSVGGNTIGFNNNDRMELNTLENLTPYLRRGYAEMGEIDEVLIALGTNDCKTTFTDRQGEIAGNLQAMLTRIRAFFEERGQDLPRIVLLTPPPIGDDDTVPERYLGAKQCVADFSAELRTIAANEGYCLVDLQQKPGNPVLSHSRDGIHFDAAGYKLLARAVISSCY